MSNKERQKVWASNDIIGDNINEKPICDDCKLRRFCRNTFSRCSERDEQLKRIVGD